MLISLTCALRTGSPVAEFNTFPANVDLESCAKTDSPQQISSVAQVLNVPCSRSCEHDLLPIRRENVELILPLGGPIRTKDGRLAIRRKLRERREPAEIGDLRQTAAVQIHHVQLKSARVAGVFVRSEQ